jgi:cytoskeleton protein RodZ
MTSIGDTLRRERLRRGLDLDKVAAETKIGRHQLEAIEANQFDRLPGGVFARSFIRQYARLLELDDEEIIAQVKQQFDEPADTAPVAEPQRSSRLPYMPSFADLYDRLRSDSSFAAFVWVVIAVLVCAGVYNLWQKNRQPLSQAAVVAAAAPRPPASRAAEPASRAAEPASLKPSVPAESAESTKAESLKTYFVPAEVSDNGTIRVPGRPPEPASPRETAGKTEVFPLAMRVAFTASEPVWVSIRSDGTRAYTGTIEGQESRQFDASRKMTVLVGNAGALQILLNGKHVGPIGPRGEIRLLVLTPHGAHVVPRTPPTPSSTSDVPDAPAEAERP